MNSRSTRLIVSAGLLASWARRPRDQFRKFNSSSVRSRRGMASESGLGTWPDQATDYFQTHPSVIGFHAQNLRPAIHHLENQVGNALPLIGYCRLQRRKPMPQQQKPLLDEIFQNRDALFKSFVW